MEFLNTLPPLVVGILIFLLRIVDVSLGTLRTIWIVQGRAAIAVIVGFFEVLIWVLAIAQVVGRVDEVPWLAPFYAGGFAAGVWVGLAIERQLAISRYVIRIISTSHGEEIAQSLRGRGHVLATFGGATKEGDVNLVYVSARGKAVREVIELAGELDPDMFYLVESARDWSDNVHPPPPLAPPPHPTGWRAIFKKK